MTPFPYKLTGPIGNRATLGLVVLQTDETIEHDFRRIFWDGEINLHVTRVPFSAKVTGDTLADMSETLPAAAHLLPMAANFDVVGYGCTSGSAVIGSSKVAELVSSVCNTEYVTDPLDSLREICAARGVKKLAFLSPYIESVSQRLRYALAARSIETPVFGTFGEIEDAKVARIAPASILAAAIELGRSADVDGVFISCTNLRTLDVIPKVEEALGKLVFSSNQVLAWNMARLAGIGDSTI